MTLFNLGHRFQYELENICRLFYPDEKIDSRFEYEDTEDDFTVITKLERERQSVVLSVSLWLEGKKTEKQTKCFSFEADDSQCERLLATLLYELLAERCGFRPKWGILTGVRPIKLLRKLTAELGEQEAGEYFTNQLGVSAQKLDLAQWTLRLENESLALSGRDSYSLYLSIPFCPTRCSYCSFVSHSIEKAGKLLEQYITSLCEEIAQTGKLAKQLGLKLETIYMGGGTPTTLSAEQMDQVLSTVEQYFDVAAAREFTVEAGRPDTIDREKLEVLKKHGVTRISINPQTLNDAVLKEIGRRHTAQQTLDAFALARKVGFTDINMDLIAGLPCDTLSSFQNTLEGVMALSPDSITVHTLSMKRASGLVTERRAQYNAQGELTSNMVDYATKRLSEEGYAPYYLYRQSKMVGNLENVGWARPGKACLYNVYIMDETHTILAVGAGAVTKLKQPGGPDIERIFNYKYPHEYISRFDTLLERKRRVMTFYEKNQI